MSNIFAFPSRPSAFVVPHADRHCAWVQAPSGHYMLLSGTWLFAETARLFVTSRGYKLINPDVGLIAVERQMHERMLPGDERVH